MAALDRNQWQDWVGIRKRYLRVGGVCDSLQAHFTGGGAGVIRLEGDDGEDDVLLLSVGEVGTRLSCSTRHVWSLLEKGEICPPVRLGRLVRWRKTDIESWVQALIPIANHSTAKPSATPTPLRRGRPRKTR